MQNEWIKILLEFNGCLIIGYLLYHFLFRKNNRHSWNRIFLVTWPLLCLVIATAQINWTVWKTVETNFSDHKASFEPIPYPEFADSELPVFQTSAPLEVPAPTIKKQRIRADFWQNDWHLLYWIGTLVMALIFLYRLGHLRHLICYSTPIRKGKYTLLEHPQLQSIFSFGSYIFKPKGNAIHPMILEHELVHVRQRHSLDLLWMEVLVIFNWFNPVIYLYRKKLKETHEFIADQSVVKQFGLLEYARLLVSQATQQKTPALGTPFAAFTKKRILTMKAKHNNPWSRLRYGVILPLFLILMTAFAIKKVERERPTQKKQHIDAQVKWGDLTCDCFKGELKGSFYCDIETISSNRLQKLIHQEPSITFKEAAQFSPKNVKQYSARIYDQEVDQNGLPIKLSDDFFAPDEPFWKDLVGGDKVAIRATLEDGQVVVFPIALEGRHPRKEVKSYIKNTNNEMIYFDEISLAGKMELSKAEFNDFINTPFSIFENGKRYEGKIGIVGLQLIDHAEFGEYYHFYQNVVEDGKILLNKPANSKQINTTELIIFSIVLKNDLAIRSKYQLLIKIKDGAPLYKQNPTIVWGGKEVKGTNFFVTKEDIPTLRNTLPKLLLNGATFYNPEQPIIADYIKRPGAPTSIKRTEFKGSELQVLINEKLDRIEKWLEKGNEFNPFYSNTRIRIPTPNGQYFDFGIRIKGIESVFDRAYNDFADGARPHFIIPINKERIERVENNFNPSNWTINHKKRLHRGIDIEAPLGSIVKSVAKGEVIKIERKIKGFGNKIVIKHANGYETVYAHLQSINVTLGEMVNPKMYIGTVGTSGAAKYPHLHFEVHKKGRAIDPLSVLSSLKDQ